MGLYGLLHDIPLTTNWKSIENEYESIWINAKINYFE